MLGLLLAAQVCSLPHFPVEVQGNEALPTEVYLALIDLPADVEPCVETADLVRQQLQDFLHKAGYDLAQVTVTVKDLGILVEINEGRLEKIVFRGRLTFQMLRLKLSLDLPREVFNRPELERQLAARAKELGIDVPTWELVPSESMHHTGPQLETLGPLNSIQGFALLHGQEKYELHVFFLEREWPTGLGLDLRSSNTDGLELGLNYQGRSMFFNDDRWRAQLMGGAGLRQNLIDRAFYVTPSRTFAEFIWMTPGLDDERRVRPLIALRGEGLARQRPDLRLENYYSVRTDLSLGVRVSVTDRFTLNVSYGLDQFYVFGLSAPKGEPAPEPLAKPQRFRGFVEFEGEYVINAGNARWDRRHALWGLARVYTNFNRPEELTFSSVQLKYQRIITFGWHDLWLRGVGTWVNGDVLFPFETPLSDFLHGVYGDVYVRAAAGGRAEYRFSLTRDLFKLGFSTEAVVYGDVNQLTNNQEPRFGVAFGPTAHTLIEGMFQLDMAVAFGFLSSGRFSTGVNVVLDKVF